MLSKVAPAFSRNLSRLDAGITQVAKDVFWIGVNDWDLREFHSMQAPIGTSYNSYLIKSSEPTIVDAVKAPLASQWIERLQTIGGQDLKGVKRIVLNHAEPDHTSGLPALMQRFPHIELCLTQMNFDTISRFYNTKGWKVNIINYGKPFSIGDREVILAHLPMAHWPESGALYLPSQKILFSNDAFGQHIATTKRFVDEIDQGTYLQEAKSYFANILLRHRLPVLKALKVAGSLPGIDMVLPSHGVGMRRQQDIAAGIKLYTDWANQKPKAKVTVLYDCNWFGTEKMAVAIASGAGKVPGVDVQMLHARRTHITRTATELVDTACLAVGSATLHEAILPDLAAHLNYLRCLNIRNKTGLVFGTYGWNNKAVPKDIRQQLFTPTKVQEAVEPVLAHWNPDSNDLLACEEAGKKLGEEALKKAK